MVKASLLYWYKQNKEKSFRKLYVDNSDSKGKNYMILYASG
jgi:hypothetical protein